MATIYATDDRNAGAVHPYKYITVTDGPHVVVFGGDVRQIQILPDADKAGCRRPGRGLCRNRRRSADAPALAHRFSRRATERR
jgi:hypothetical protein